MLLNCGVGENSWESLGLQSDPTSPSKRKSVLNIHWKDWHWGRNSNTLATWCKEPTHWKRRWCWETLKSEEGEDRGQDSWMTSPTWWTWVEQTPGVGDGQRSLVCCSPWSHRVGHDWMTELNWGKKRIKMQGRKEKIYSMNAEVQRARRDFFKRSS